MEEKTNWQAAEANAQGIQAVCLRSAGLIAEIC